MHYKILAWPLFVTVGLKELESALSWTGLDYLQLHFITMVMVSLFSVRGCKSTSLLLPWPEEALLLSAPLPRSLALCFSLAG